jgi:DNA replication protein DnaC
MHDQLRALIAQLRLHGMADALDAELARAEREAIAVPELLYRLLGHEAASRRERSLAYRLVQARLPWQWSLDSFPFDRQPGVSKAQIQTLAGLDFLAASTRRKSCSTNFTPRWLIARPPGCWAS